MSASITAWSENADGEVSTVWNIQCYALFGWLATVRNYAGLPVASFVTSDNYPERRTTYPESEKRIYVASLENLLAFDYDQPVENRRDCGQTLPKGEGVMTTYRELFGEVYFADLKEAHEDDATQIAFYFDY